MDLSLNRQKVILILITAVLLFGLVILAGSLSQVELRPGEAVNWTSLLKGGGGYVAAPTSNSGASSAGLSVIFMILFWAGLAATIIFAFISPTHRERLLAGLGIITLILIFRIVVAQRIADLQGLAVNEVPLDLDPSSSTPLPEPPAFITNPPDWIIWVVGGVVLALLATFAFFIWYRRRRVEPVDDPQRLFVQEAEQALQDLDAGGDVKDVVLRCYVQMEGVMRQSQDIERQQSMTPREFEGRLSKAGFSDEHIGRLVRLFEGVRYGERPSDGRAEREARDCLTAIVASYG